MRISVSVRLWNYLYLIVIFYFFYPKELWLNTISINSRVNRCTKILTVGFMYKDKYKYNIYII
jgi:hypothetical protein